MKEEFLMVKSSDHAKERESGGKNKMTYNLSHFGAVWVVFIEEFHSLLKALHASDVTLQSCARPDKNLIIFMNEISL